MDIRELPEPDLFLEAALSNFDEADWHMWSEGLCVQRENSVLAYLSETKGAIVYLTAVKDVFIVGSKIALLSSEGSFLWDGLGEPEALDCPYLTHLKLTETEEDGILFCAWNDFRYVLGTAEEQVLLPLNCTKPQFFPNQRSVFWVYWGKIFIWKDAEVECLEAFAEDYEELIPLGGTWLVAVYEKSLIAFHPAFPKKRFDNDRMMEVRASSQGDCIWILLADGSLLEWNPQQEDEPEELDCLDGADGFVGEGMLLVEDEVQSWL